MIDAADMINAVEPSLKRRALDLSGVFAVKALSGRRKKEKGADNELRIL